MERFVLYGIVLWGGGWDRREMIRDLSDPTHYPPVHDFWAYPCTREVYIGTRFSFFISLEIVLITHRFVKILLVIATILT